MAEDDKAPEEQILKCRDDKAPIRLRRADGQDSFTLSGDTPCSWIPSGEPVTPDKLRTQIEPWLTALFQSEHLALLIGSGLTHGVYQMATGNHLPGMSKANFSNFADALDQGAKTSATKAGRTAANIEDQLRVANELLRGLEIVAPFRTDLPEKVDLLRNEISTTLDQFAQSILAGENGFFSASPDKLTAATNYLVSFLMSFASRTGTRERLHLFTTNYDRFIELGAELAGLHLFDRFVGSLAPIFRSSRLDVDMHYNPPGIRGEPRYLEGVAKFTKLHGSVDWVDTSESIRRTNVPFGATSITPYLDAPGLYGATPLQMMIYPNAAKDRETAAYPYVDLFRDFAAAICRPNSTVVCFGYSFGDEHINRVMEDMLTIPSTHLVIIAHGDSLGRIIKTYEKMGRPAQITLLIGSHLGDFKALVDNYLPKPAIDRTTFRMAELLKQRWTTTAQSKSESASPPEDEENLF